MRLVGTIVVMSILVLSLLPAADPVSGDTLEDFTSPPGTVWAQLFLDNARARSITHTEGGYIVAGEQWGDVAPWNWAALVRLAENGNIDDYATFHALDNQNAAYEARPVYSDTEELEGYIVTGYRFKHFSEDGHEYYDPWVWLMKTDTTLDMLWDNRYGTPSDDRGNSVALHDDGYTIGGWEGLGGPAGNGYLVGATADGTISWEIKGDPTDDPWLAKEVHSVENTSDGGLILSTETGIIKLDTSSPPVIVEWETVTDCYYAVKQTADGGYIGVGSTDGVFDSPDVILTKPGFPISTGHEVSRPSLTCHQW